MIKVMLIKLQIQGLIILKRNLFLWKLLFKIKIIRIIHHIHQDIIKMAKSII
jgi:hypothetical protein